MQFVRTLAAHPPRPGLTKLLSVFNLREKNKVRLFKV
jgi:hypothetical protein